MALSSLPTITRPNQITQQLKIWQTAINPLLQVVPTPKAPWNFAAKNAQGGIELTWAPLTNNQADGYQILRSSTPDFSVTDATYTLPGASANSFYDALPSSGANPTVTKYYKLRATNGTPTNPQSVLGVLTGIVSQTSIAMNNTTIIPTTNRDTTTNDKTQVQAGRAVRVSYPTILNPKFLL